MVTISAPDIPGFRHEAGGHRIQRVPPTERRGRVHTSTVTVAVLFGEQRETPYDRRGEDDFSKRWFGSTGAGGQHANKHHNSLELTHVPTGISVKAQGRSRAANERDAMEGLLAELDRRKRHGDHQAVNAVRAGQVGSGMRGDKRRTYRFQDDSIEDHETNRRVSCKTFMRGDIESLWR